MPINKSFKLKLIFSYIFIVLVSFSFVAIFLDKNLEKNSLHNLQLSLIAQANLIGVQIPSETIKKYADALDAERHLVFVADSGDALYKEIGGFSMPETIFVDASGVIRDHVRGKMDAVEIKRRIQDAFGL